MKPGELLKELACRSVLNHASGFISRGNATGGLKHIENAIAEEQDAGPAW